AAIFRYIDAWFIKPLPYPQPDRLVIFETQDKKHGWTSGGVTSAADFFDFQKQNTSFEQTVAWGGASLNLTGDGLPELVDGGRVSWNFFDTLGAKPIFGRTFTAEDDRSGPPHVAILSQGLWQGRYAGDPKIIGRNIAIGGEAYAVVGVMPGTFQLPLMGIANLWTPLALTDMQRADRGNVWLPALGRLEPGATRRRLAGQLLTESLLLFLVGGVASLLFGSWGMRWIESQIPGHIRGYIVNYGHVEMDFSMLMFTLGITLLCGLVFGFAPAFE